MWYNESWNNPLKNEVRSTFFFSPRCPECSISFCCLNHCSIELISWVLSWVSPLSWVFHFVLLFEPLHNKVNWLSAILSFPQGCGTGATQDLLIVAPNIYSFRFFCFCASVIWSWVANEPCRHSSFARRTAFIFCFFTFRLPPPALLVWKTKNSWVFFKRIPLKNIKTFLKAIFQKKVSLSFLKLLQPKKLLCATI